MATKVLTGKARLSYVNLFEGRPDDSGVTKFGVKLLIPKSDTATIAAMRAAQEEAVTAGNEGKFNGKKIVIKRDSDGNVIPGQKWDTIHDGDESDALEDQGHWTLNVSSKNRPGVVDRQVKPILDPTEVYSGCYGRASLNAYPYNFNGKIGVSFGLNHIQKLADGDPLDGRTRAEDEFDEVEGDDDDMALL